jgi:hypothetical protein
MYPLNMKLAEGVGFAVANDEDEHRALTNAGYGPAYVAPVKPKATKAAANTGIDGSTDDATSNGA